jgi:hypothetical protein
VTDVSVGSPLDPKKYASPVHDHHRTGRVFLVRSKKALVVAVLAFAALGVSTPAASAADRPLQVPAAAKCDGVKFQWKNSQGKPGEWSGCYKKGQHDFANKGVAALWVGTGRKVAVECRGGVGDDTYGPGNHGNPCPGNNMIGALVS